ncbi:MAG: 6,7-dimethyl-8-ribityllumazine synthase [Hyphomicrobiales bacterium]|nr:6,7-dimethyl-8-ribityllumazine synthase [Rickettsiales bacterium]MCP5361570.1 6,7-dimethyl-8-ribityllumazine synthase [Hyphomicrobiales bacterium]
MKILILSARFYDDIADALENGAKQALESAGIAYECVYVPGAFEIPAALSMAMKTKKYDGYIALGCVIRGETTHYDYVAGESARALMDLSMRKRIALGYGILTCENRAQAEARAHTDQGNKGAAVAQACLDMLNLQTQFAKSKKKHG